MNIPQLLQAAKADLDRLKAIYDSYPDDTDLSDYTREDRREVRNLQAGIKAYEAALREAVKPSGSLSIQTRHSRLRAAHSAI